MVGLSNTAQASSSKGTHSVQEVKRAICNTFGMYCGEALRVARCESRYDTGAVNGQYVNIFQMGSWERRTYGWHDRWSSPWIASRAAYRYFAASGYDWSPWTCKPWW